MSAETAATSHSSNSNTVYTIDHATVLHCCHTLPAALGHCPADSFIAHPRPPSASIPPLVLSFRHHPPLSTSDALRVQLFAFISSLYSLAAREHRRLRLRHAHIARFEQGTNIGQEVNAGAVMVQLPAPALSSFLSSLPADARLSFAASPSSSSSFPSSRPPLFCLLASAAELGMAESAGVSRLLGIKAWKEAEAERKTRSDPRIHFFPFPVCSDLTRSVSLVPAALPAAVEERRVKAGERKLSKQEQLQQKLRERKEGKQKEAGGRQQRGAVASGQEERKEDEDSEGEMQPALSLLDRSRCYRLYGSSVYREGRTVRLQVGDVQEMQAVVQRIEQDNGGAAGKKPIALLTGLPDAQWPVKVWAAYTSQQQQRTSSTAASWCHLLSPCHAADSSSSSSSRLYGCFLCLFPSVSSAADEGRDSEDGFTLFLTPPSCLAIQQYLRRRLRLSVLADTTTGLHFDLRWPDGQPQRQTAADGEAEEADVTADDIAQYVRRFVTGVDVSVRKAELRSEAAECAMASSRARSQGRRQAVLDWAVLLCRLMEKELLQRRQSAGALVAELRSSGDGRVDADVRWEGQTAAAAGSAEAASAEEAWKELRYRMRQLPSPAFSLQLTLVLDLR